MNPTLGRIVIYHTTEKQRLQMKNNLNCNVQEYLPAIVVAIDATWSGAIVNLTLLLDGDGSLWITSIQEGDEEGQWHWPEIQD